MQTARQRRTGGEVVRKGLVEARTRNIDWHPGDRFHWPHTPLQPRRASPATYTVRQPKRPEPKRVSLSRLYPTAARYNIIVRYICRLMHPMPAVPFRILPLCHADLLPSSQRCSILLHIAIRYIVVGEFVYFESREIVERHEGKHWRFKFQLMCYLFACAKGYWNKTLIVKY